MREGEVNKDMEKRVISLEGRMDRIEEVTADLKRSDENQWMFLKEIKEELKEQKQEMKIKMDAISSDVGSLRTETASRSGELHGILSIMTKQNDDLMSLVKSNNESSAGIQKEKVINSRTWWQGFFQVMGIAFTSAAGVIGAIVALGKLFGL